LKADLSLSNAEISRLQDHLKEAEEIADQWQNKFREQQDSLKEKFALFKNLKDQTKELENEINTLKAANAELTEKLQKQTSDQSTASDAKAKKKTLTVGTPSKSSQRLSIAPSSFKTNQLTQEFEKLKEDYENIKISHDLLRDERHSLTEQCEKYKKTLEIYESQNAALLREKYTLQTENSSIASQLEDTNSKLSFAQNKLLELQNQLKETRATYQIKLEEMENSETHRIAERYREVLAINSEYEIQLQAVFTILSQDLQPILESASNMKKKMTLFESKFPQIQNALFKSQESLRHYKALCTESMQIIHATFEENKILNKQLDCLRENEARMVEQIAQLSTNLLQEQNHADSVAQELFSLRQQFDMQSSELISTRDALYMQTEQVNYMLDEIPILEESVESLEIKKFTTEIMLNVISKNYSSLLSERNSLRSKKKQLKESNSLLKNQLEQAEEGMYVLYENSKQSIAYLEDRIQKLQNTLADADKRYNELVEFSRIEKNIWNETIEQEKNQNTSLQFKLSQLESKYTQSALVLESMEKCNLELQENLEKSRYSISDLQRELSTARAEIESLKKANCEKDIQLRESHSNEKLLRENIDLISSLQNEVEQLRMIRASLEQELRNCMINEKQMKEQFNRDISIAKNELEHVKQMHSLEIEQHKRNNVLLQSTVSNLEEKFQQSARKHEELENANQKLSQTLTKMTIDFNAAQIALAETRNKVDRLTNMCSELESELKISQNNEKFERERFHQDLSQYLELNQKLEEQLKEINFECTKLRGQNKQLTLQLDILLSKTQKSDWNNINIDLTDIELLKGENDRLSIQISALSQEISSLKDKNISLVKERNELRHSSTEMEKILQENFKRALLEIKALETSLINVTNILKAYPSIIQENPQIAYLLNDVSRRKSLTETQNTADA
jgi:chromosome segregation ATPase